MYATAILEVRMLIYSGVIAFAIDPLHAPTTIGLEAK
jgi:hypothetical protein